MTLAAITRLLALPALLLLGTLPGGAAGLDAVWSWATSPSVTDEAQLELNAQIIRRGSASNATRLAARVSQEGHWTFVNAAGETFTAASEPEIKRAFEVLLPEAASRSPTFLLTGDSLFERRALLAQLPKAAELGLGWGDESFRLEMIGTGASSQYLVEIKPNLLVELTTSANFAEALKLLRRPMERQRFRVVSLEPGGPRALSSTPRIDPATGKPDVDPIDPSFIAASLGALKGQTAVIIGRPDSGQLAFKPASGPERTTQIGLLAGAAAAADADLLILKSTSAQQPGGRNWLWQRVEVKGLDQALEHATLADFFDALGSSSNRLVMSIDRPTMTRTSFDLRQLPGKAVEVMSASRIGGVVSDAVTSLVGNVVHTGAIGYFRSSERQAELDRRILPFVPSIMQWVYVTLLALGILGVSTSWRWWRKLWPSENAAEYNNVFGFWAARVIRLTAYFALFMPLSALVAAPLAAGRAASRLFGRKSEPVKSAT